MSTENSKLQDFMDAFCLENLSKEPTCFKSTVPTTIDLIVTNQKSLFMKLIAYESGLSNYHKLTPIILRESTTRGNPRNILYMDHNPFMSKALRKASMVRSKLKNKFNKNRPGENRDSYKKHKLLCKPTKEN